MRGSWPRATRSSSIAISIFLSAGSSGTAGARAPRRRSPRARRRPPRRRRWDRSRARAPHRDLAEADRGLANSHRLPLTILAAGAGAAIDLEVVRHRVDLEHGVVAVAGEGGVPHRLGEPAVHDPVGLGDLEREVAVGGVERAAAPALHIEAPATLRDLVPPRVEDRLV